MDRVNGDTGWVWWRWRGMVVEGGEMGQRHLSMLKFEVCSSGHALP